RSANASVGPATVAPASVANTFSSLSRPLARWPVSSSDAAPIVLSAESSGASPAAFAYWSSARDGLPINVWVCPSNASDDEVGGVVGRIDRQASVGPRHRSVRDAPHGEDCAVDDDRFGRARIGGENRVDDWFSVVALAGYQQPRHRELRIPAVGVVRYRL